MPDSLSQEQIDAMLSQALSGGVIETTEDEDTSEIKEYDFRSPKKFTKEKIKLLESIFENYSRLLSSYLTGLMRLYCKVTLISIEEQRYFEYNNALPDYVMMGIIDLGIQSPDIEEFTSILQLSNSLTFIMIDRLLGGKGEYRDTDRDFTEIETNVMRRILENMAKMLKEPWESYLELVPELLDVETNSRVVSSVDYDDTMIIVALEVAVADTKSIISICIPALNLNEVMEKYGSKTVRAAKRTPDATKEMERKESIMSALNQSTLEIKAVLSETQLDMSDVMYLQVNDIIPLGKSIDSNISLRIGGRDWFDGKLGTLNSKKAVKIENVYRIEV